MASMYLPEWAEFLFVGGDQFLPRLNPIEGGPIKN